jgi:hypothetical protein
VQVSQANTALADESQNGLILALQLFETIHRNLLSDAPRIASERITEY